MGTASPASPSTFVTRIRYDLVCPSPDVTVHTISFSPSCSPSLPDTDTLEASSAAGALTVIVSTSPPTTAV